MPKQVTDKDAENMLEAFDAECMKMGESGRRVTWFRYSRTDRIALMRAVLQHFLKENK